MPTTPMNSQEAGRYLNIPSGEIARLARLKRISGKKIKGRWQFFLYQLEVYRRKDKSK
ncbi:hypothetical protein K8R42_04245 [bacterium]|nr:hypothetical protein [bacterium]